MEECGYNVPTNLIQPIKRYVTGVSTSGSTQHLFYAEIVRRVFLIFFGI